MTNLFAYTIFYILLSAGIIYPPKEFVSAGFTIAEIFSSWLGSESDAFIQYHIKRSIVTLLLHSLLPFGYIAGLFLFGHTETAQIFIGTEHPLFLTQSLCALIGPIYALCKVINWSSNNWSKHPIAKSLSVYCTDNKSWIDIASEINHEFHSFSKLQIYVNTTTKVVVTDNWIMQISSYRLEIANQNNSKLVCYKVNVYPSTQLAMSYSTYAKYRVCTRQPGGKNFSIRLNYNDIENFKGKIIMPIIVMPSCEFPKRLEELCIDWIKEEISKNSFYFTNQELEKCTVCINADSNIKLVRRCLNNSEIDGTTSSCEVCNCPPRLCIDCLVKWFMASSSSNLTRQMENLMQSKSSCPQCRSIFCLLDVSLVIFDPLYVNKNEKSEDSHD